MPPPTLNYEEPVRLRVRGALGINHQSPLIYCAQRGEHVHGAGNQSPIPFDILWRAEHQARHGWESITNPL